MISAEAATAASRTALNAMTDDLKLKLQKVISAATEQGSCKATFHPRNAFENENAVHLLREYGYKVESRPAGDQRDQDRINISWG